MTSGGILPKVRRFEHCKKRNKTKGILQYKWRCVEALEGTPALLSKHGPNSVEVRKHRFTVFGQGCAYARHIPRNIRCRHKPTLPLK